MTRSPTPLHLARLVHLVLTLLLVAAPAIALDGRGRIDPADELHTPPVSPRELVLAFSTQHGAERSAIARWWEQLEGLPLRPVTIGETPRLPDDPEPGVGLVWKLRF
jgi:hypothetical protein